MNSRRHNKTHVTKTTRPSLMTRLRGRNAHTRTVKTTTKVEPGYTHHTHGNQAAYNNHGTARRSWGRRHRQPPAVIHKRRASIGDKISGAMLILKGTLTDRPGVKAAGTRRMHGTDGRGSHRVY
ncbi:hypothetical protein B7494_g1488 [Chlorociboria aeruginascens]|nr:hypothetical protein B7494_g1488 [Chlorociboria aeruginascens]